MNKYEYTDLVKRSEKVWQDSYFQVAKVIDKYKIKYGVEVGVAYGGNSANILKTTKIKKLYGVDPYKHIDNYKDLMNISQEEFDDLHKFVIERMSKYNKRYSHIRGISSDAVKKIDSPIDFVYIDADHSYEGVLNDLGIWYTKIRIGGIISGHDYNHSGHPGVRKAVDEFFMRFNYEINTGKGGVWWVEKKRINVSFIIPMFNSEDTIKKTIQSIFDGNLNKNDELIVIDDKSTDDSIKIVNKLKARYQNIKIIKHNINKGTAAAGRNTGIEYAKNDLVFCLDSDNCLEKESVDNLKNVLITQNAEAACFDEIWFFKETIEDISKKWKFKEGDITLADALSGNVWPGSSGNYLFTKNSWIKAGRYTEPSLINQTLDSWTFAIRQLGVGCKFITLKDSHYYHKFGHNSHFIREQGRSNRSIAALSGLLPFIDQLENSSLNYVLSKRSYDDWFEKLDKKPLRIKGGGKGKNGKIINYKSTSNSNKSIVNFFSKLKLFDKESYSLPPKNQLFESHVEKLIKIIKPKRNGFYIECGANDGVFFSYTYRLEKKFNWRGVLVEPSVQAYKKCKKFRSGNNYFYNCALVSDEYNDKYISGDFDGNYMSSISGKRLERDQNKKVKAVTLTALLKEIDMKYIDLFSLDVEGYELQVLKGLNFDIYRPKFLLIEIYKEQYKIIVDYLEGKGYKLISNITDYNNKNNPLWDGTHNDYLFKTQ